MGKPYNHNYHFAGTGNSTGTMICGTCGKPICNQTQDWMSYAQTKSYDWAVHCFHRKCVSAQSGWKNIENKQRTAIERNNAIKRALIEVATKYKIIDGYSFAEYAAAALGCDLEAD